MKFIIDIPEKDVQGCYDCPLNYDFIECAAPNGPDYVDICDYLGNSNITTRPEGCPLVPVVPDQDEMDRNWPETVGELFGACERLSNSRDLYTLGERGKPYAGESEPRVDGTDWLAGEYQYGVAMIPAQWVTHVLLDGGDADSAVAALRRHTSVVGNVAAGQRVVATEPILSPHGTGGRSHEHDKRPD